jgi:anti-anti-sigma regulatory factor
MLVLHGLWCDVKKIRNWARYQSWQAARRKKYLARHRVSAYKLKIRRGSSHGVQLSKSARRKDRLEPETIKAPAVFSLLDNPNEFLEFLRVVDQKLRTRHLFIDMSGVTMLTAEAISTFVAVMKSLKHENVKVRGNLPSSPSLAAKLEEFGFYDQVVAPKSFTPATEARKQGTILLRGNQFKVEKDNTVQAEIAGKMVDFARRLFPEDLHKGVFTMFMEATTNTVEHASRTDEPMRWVAGAYFDKERNVMSFTVIDRGVGILNSVKFRRALDALWGRMAWDSGEKLQQLFLGKMRSETQEPHRGLGIPGAFTAFKAGRIKDLAIISNRGFAHARMERYVELRTAFDGTIIYWEA